MGFEDERGDFFRGGGPRHSKRQFLIDLVRFGALMTSGFGGEEVPYWGAGAHACELQGEGLIELSSEQPFPDVRLWVPTDAGRRSVKRTELSS
jgi:hypothetical protein